MVYQEPCEINKVLQLVKLRFLAYRALNFRLVGPISSINRLFFFPKKSPMVNRLNVVSKSAILNDQGHF
jgi:hypothetical protein